MLTRKIPTSRSCARLWGRGVPRYGELTKPGGGATEMSFSRPRASARNRIEPSRWRNPRRPFRREVPPPAPAAHGRGVDHLLFLSGFLLGVFAILYAWKTPALTCCLNEKPSGPPSVASFVEVLEGTSSSHTIKYSSSAAAFEQKRECFIRASTRPRIEPYIEEVRSPSGDDPAR